MKVGSEVLVPPKARKQSGWSLTKGAMRDGSLNSHLQRLPSKPNRRNSIKKADHGDASYSQFTDSRCPRRTLLSRSPHKLPSHPYRSSCPAPTTPWSEQETDHKAQCSSGPKRPILSTLHLLTLPSQEQANG